jgi:hypothetical protein
MRRSLKTSLALAVAAAVSAGVVAGAGSASREQATPPHPIAPPTITGLIVGQKLTAQPGRWSGTGPFQYLYQWIRSDGGDGTPIKGATGQTYVVSPDDLGHKLFVQVKAVNTVGHAWGNSTWTSAATGATVADAVKLADGRTSVLVNHVTLPDRLVVTTTGFTPLRLSASGSVLARVTVVDRLQRPVRGALVAVTALPFGSLAQPVETPTDANGVATIALKGRPQVLKHVPGGAIALSVRARKPGDDVLTGVTGQRLVELRISK